VLPLVALAPLQAPEAAHEVAFVELHMSVAEVPAPIMVGLADSVTDGAAAAAVTVTVTVALLAPPAPVQFSA
jgi:hypothetical protein